MERLSHLPEEELNKLIKEDPYITIKEYRGFLLELSDIEKSTENGTEENDH